MASFSTVVQNLKDTQAFGEKLGAACVGGEVIFLTGELGAGKTTLTQSIALGLGIKSVVTSPTFIIVNEYLTERDIELVHVDLYRVKTLDDLATTGIWDLLVAPGTVTVVEWPERIDKMEDLPHLHISISGEGEGRTFQIDQHGNSPVIKTLLESINNVIPAQVFDSTQTLSTVERAGIGSSNRVGR